MKSRAEISWYSLILLLGVLLLLAPGCASLREWDKPLAGCLAACQRFNIAPTHYILTVDVSRQTVSLFEQTRLIQTFPCSTSRYGVGEAADSSRTPRGLHRIAEKFGDGETAGTIFRDRIAVGHVLESGKYPPPSRRVSCGLKD